MIVKLTMPHSLIIGMTESGKTTLAKKMSLHYRQRGIHTIVLDPMYDPNWQASFQTANPHKFLEIVKKSSNCAIFIDESGDIVGRYDEEMHWLATKARHWGHNSHFISQRAKQISKTVRDQCSFLFAFNMSYDDSKELANEFNKEILKTCNILNKGEYYVVPRYGEVKKFYVF